MRTWLTFLAVATIGLESLAPVATAGSMGPTFTYQGRLTDGGSDVTDPVDLEFRLFDAASGGAQVGLTVFVDDYVPSEGLVSLDLDFGAESFDGDERWLEVTVEGTPLTPRQSLRAAPYANFALNAPFNVNGSDVYYTGGNVGIGTSDPDGLLHVDGRIRSSGAGAGLTVYNPENENASFNFNWLDNVARWRVGGNGAGANGGFDFQRIGDQSMFRIAGNGNVGIGITDPVDDLHINDNDAVLRLMSSSGGTWGSTINLTEQIGGTPSNNWQIIRSTSGSGSTLRFRYDPNGDNSHSTRMTIDDLGNVGINTTTPDARLQVVQTDPNEPAALITSSDSLLGLPTLDVRNFGSGHGAQFVADPLGTSGDGVRGITHGTGAGVYGVADVGDGVGVFAEAGNGGAIPFVANYDGPAGGDLAIFRFLGNNRARINDNGRGYFNGGTQTGGADVAEAFEVEGVVSDYEPGDVLVISTERDRTVAISVEPYSTLVAGVHATKPGVLLSERHIDACHDDTVPMGVVGVVPTKVSGENGPIRRGDLLVTSSIPGHAMKGTDRGRMIGAIIGKALEEFDGSGTGVIRVMVNVK
jgi:YD repeat-containing protein